GRPERLWRWGKRNPAVAALLATLVLGTLTGFATLGWRLRVEAGLRQDAEKGRAEADRAWEGEKAERRRAERAVYVSRLAQAQREWRSHASRQARALLLSCPEDYRGWEWQYLREVYQGGLLTIKDGREPDPCLAISPDGKLLATPEEDHTVNLWDVA